MKGEQAMKTFIILAVVLFASVAMAGEYTIKTNIPDFTPGDGFMDAGSPLNPYVVTDSYGREVGKIQSRSLDLDPYDNFMDPGSTSNPWILKTDD